MWLREDTDNVPKPLVPIGNNPIIWHLMKYHIHFGQEDFVLCLGYIGESIKRFSVDYNEALSSDFVLSEGGRKLELLSTDFRNWSITFVDTGAKASLGECLRAVREHLKDEEVFLANYVDGLTNFDPINEALSYSGVACFVRTFGQVEITAATLGLDLRAVLDPAHGCWRVLIGLFVTPDHVQLFRPRNWLLGTCKPSEANT